METATRCGLTLQQLAGINPPGVGVLGLEPSQPGKGSTGGGGQCLFGSWVFGAKPGLLVTCISACASKVGPAQAARMKSLCSARSRGREPQLLLLMHTFLLCNPEALRLASSWQVELKVCLLPSIF